MDHSHSYSQIEVSGLGQSELESRALIRTASGLNQIKENWDERKSELEEVYGFIMDQLYEEDEE